MGAPVQLCCPECGTYYLTRIRSNTTRCPECTAPRWVPAMPVWEGPDRTATGLSGAAALDRPPYPLDCYACGHRWTTTAAGGSTIRCPGRPWGDRRRCGHPARVPIDRPATMPADPPARPTPARPMPAPTVRPDLAGGLLSGWLDRMRQR